MIMINEVNRNKSSFMLFTGAKKIKLRFLLQLTVNSRTTPFIFFKKRLKYPLPLSSIEDTIRHNIAQITSTSKAYIPCPLIIIIK